MRTSKKVAIGTLNHRLLYRHGSGQRVRNLARFGILATAAVIGGLSVVLLGPTSPVPVSWAGFTPTASFTVLLVLTLGIGSHRGSLVGKNQFGSVERFPGQHPV